MTHDPELDLLLVGCGLRGTGLLSANPDLLAYRIGVIDAGEQPGPGNFPFYRIDSNSYGSDFFGWVDPQRVYGAALRDADVIALRESVGSFPLARLAQALRPFGAIIRRELGAGRVWLRRRAVRIDVDQDGVTVQLDDGSRVRSRLVVLATGIRERVHAELLPWRHKLLLSRQIIEHGPPAAWRDTPVRVHLLGGSHSAYAIARLLAEPGTLAAGSSVTLQHRGLVKLFYGSHEEYAAAEHAALEAVPDLERDRCPETGNVFRYSGLRHAARHTFREIAANRLAGFAQIRAARLGDAAPRLDEADCIVQALGYESNTLPLEVDGRPVPMCAPGGIVLPGADGRLALPGIALSPLFVMGMNPYPYDDNSLTPTGQYALRGAQVLRALREHATPAAAAALSDSPTHSAQ
ncbi:hypothetical protein [Burkholderia sp. Ap-962]|uniref:hypothetical protein n=1 Tax=Burkholderia sp. Ap-962 TaxID=2608333 RepID=UPI0019623CF7|nr:hypothetical protein [Burkholderia sp. Ap-962]